MITEILLFIIFFLAVLLFVFYRKALALEAKLGETIFSKNSQSVRYGKITEQFAPFIEEMPFSVQNFRFLGSPIDGIAFEPEKIIFCEFKTADSKLSQLQQNIKQLVEGKKIEWLEFKIR